MKFHQFVLSLATALHKEDGITLAALLCTHGSKADELLNDLQDSRKATLTRTASSVAQPWNEIAVSHVQVLVHALDSNFIEAYQEQASVVQSFFRYFMSNNGWSLPLLYTLLRDLRGLASQADEAEYSIRGLKNKWLEDAARICNKAFSLCVTDRASPKDVSRKWGAYCTIGLVFKCYFKINTTSLARNVLRAMDANRDIPPLHEFPRADQVTYKYYLGMLNFLKEDWSQAEEDLTLAFYYCHHQSIKNLNRILIYLLPLRFLRGHLPTHELLDQFPIVRYLYGPLVNAIREGNLKAFDDAFNNADRQKRFLDLGLYIIVEKTRELCMRGLFRKVWLVLEKPTRMPVSMFHAGLRVAGQDIDVEEAECFTAVMIFKGYIRGYISHEKQTVVLATSDAFPPLTQRPNPYA